ncbi:uncharacterized protein A1O5_08517 [Cladophialophora psammophila CBS 110553]|uniref:Uncharacterized protein n=1 Tax=Cladophialophora psammophila CBS 110553 TaxID=1182543 RepID=W9WLC6_9EURO|nr:uncharacterized protein A1O5_08517 [Cladophialophora psammophila CBS 110553]EXJ68723.1 hypothetical protein A1O5_08517 [Cladophialophora psammophila CBS 110553]
MTSHQTQGHHDPNSCPEVQRRLGTEAEVHAILQDAQQIALPQRGVSAYLNLRLDELPKSADLMVTDDEEDLDTIFENVSQSRMYRRMLLPNKRGWDITIPEAPDQLRAHVKVLFKAFKSIPDECACQEAIKRPFRSQIHDNYLVECLCWEILEACIERSKKDANLVEAWEPGKFRYKKTNDWTFEERFNSIVETMATSKTICKHLFDVKYVLKIVDDPKTNAERVEANRKLNGLKARVMKRGKEAEAQDQRQIKRARTEDADDDEDGDFSSPVRPEPQRSQRASVTAGPAKQPVTTPTRPSIPIQHPASAPATMNMAPPAVHRSRRQPSLQPSPLPRPSSFFDNSPTRRSTPSGMFGNIHRPSVSPGFARAMQAGSPMQRNGMQPYSPMFTAGYATPSDARFHPTQTTPGSRSASRASAQHTDSLTPSERGSSHSWLGQPVQESYGLNSDYTSRTSSTVSHQSFMYSASEQPQWDPSYNYALNGGLTDAATTFGDDDGFRERPQENMSMSELLEKGEAEQALTHGGSTESEEGEDGDGEFEFE